MPMQMIDSIKRGIRRMAMSAAILAAPLARANTTEAQPEETERATITMTENHQDLYARYQNLTGEESAKGYTQNLSPELTGFLVKNHTTLKEKLLSDFDKEDAYNQAHKLEADWTKHQELKKRLQDFQNDMKALYETLTKKSNLGMATALETELLESLKAEYAPAPQSAVNLAQKFGQLLETASPDNQNGREDLASFLVEHYEGVKRIASTPEENQDICQQFLLNRQQLYQTLRQKVEDGTADSVDKLTLSAISVKDQGKLNQFLNGISYNPDRDQDKNPTIYKAVTGLVEQMNEYMDVFKIHPDSRLNLAQSLFQNCIGASEKTDCLDYGNGIKINTNKLAEFLEKTGTTIETDNGIRFVLNNPNSRTPEGFEISLKKSDIMRSMQCIGQAYRLLCEEDSVLGQDVNMIFQEVAQNPGIGTLRKLPDEISRLIEENRDVISPEAREQVGKYLTQAAQIPFLINFHDSKGSRPATRADADKCVDIILDTVYAMDDAGVIDISEIAKQNKGSTIIGLAAKSKWLAKRFLKGDITEGFYSFLNQRDEALFAAKDRETKSGNMLAQSDSKPEGTNATGSGSKPTSPKWDMASMVAMNGGR